MSKHGEAQRPATASAPRAARRHRRSQSLATPYRAFISYSHAVDGRLAPALQSALHHFAKPWHQLRAIRVFRDQTSLSADPGLWSSIETALGNSEFFILLASPEAAASEWVNREVAWWMANKDPHRLLIGLTGGDVAWNRQTGDFDWSRTTSMPLALRNALADEPRLVDLRWAAHEDHLSMGDPRFRDCVADIAAPLHRRPKDELFGEDVRQHRRTIRIARTVGASLAALALVATVAAFVAVNRQRQATAQARLAISRQLAVTATDLVDSQYDLALLLAAQAVRTQDTPQARASLFSVLERNRQHVGFLSGAGAAMTVVRISSDGTLLAAGDARGTVSLWRLPEAERVGELRLSSPAAIESLAIAPDRARLMAGAGDGQVGLWDLNSGAGNQVPRHDQPVRAVAFSPDGSRVASGDARGTVLVADVGSPNPLATFLHLDEPLSTGDRIPLPVRGLSFSPSGLEVSVAGQGLISTWEVGSGTLLAQREPVWSPSLTRSVFSDDLSHEAESIGKGGYSLAVQRTDGSSPSGSPSSSSADGGRTSASLLPGEPDTLAFSPDERLLAVAGQGAVRLFELDPLEPEPNTPVLTGYPSAITNVSISSDRRWLAAASGNVVVLSDLTRRYRLGRVVAEPKDVCGTCSGGNTVSVSPDGRVVAWLDDGGTARTGASPRVRFWDLLRNTEIRDFPVDGSGTIAFRPDGKSLVTASPVSTWDLEGNRLAGPVEPEDDIRRERALSVAFTSTGGGLVLSAVEDKESRWRLHARDADGGGVLFEGPPTEELPVATVSSSGIVAYSGADGSINLWDMQRARAMPVLPPAASVADAHSSVVDDLAFDGQGTQLASLSGGTITVWDVAEQRQMFTLSWGSRGALRFAPDGSRFGAAAQDGTLTVWDVKSRQLLATVRGQAPFNGFPHMAFTPDGTTLASVVPGGGLVLSDMNLARWLREACVIAGRDLTPSERESYAASDLAPRHACR